MTTQDLRMEKSNEMVINFVAAENNTPIDMDVSNTKFQSNLRNKHIVLTYLELDNTLVPIFIPHPFTNTSTVISDFTKVDPLGNSTISIDYLWGIQNIADDTKKFWGACQFVNPDPSIPAPQMQLNLRQMYNDEYFNVFDITVLLGQFTETLKHVLLNNTYAPIHPHDNNVEFVYDSVNNTISLMLDKEITKDWNIFVNPELGELLQFKTQGITGNDYWRQIVHDGETAFQYKSVIPIVTIDSQQFNSRFISRQWVSWDTVLIDTTLPLKAVEYQNNAVLSSGSSVSFKNTILALNTVESSINFYPYYSFVTNSTDKYLSFSDDSFEENIFNLKVLLYNKRLNLSAPYKLKKGEILNISLSIFVS